MNNKLKSEIIATIDELNQYLNGNVTKAGLQIALSDLIKKLEKTNIDMDNLEVEWEYASNFSTALQTKYE